MWLYHPTRKVRLDFMFLVKYVATLINQHLDLKSLVVFTETNEKKLVVIHPSVDHPRRTVSQVPGPRPGRPVLPRLGFHFFGSKFFRAF